MLINWRKLLGKWLNVLSKNKYNVGLTNIEYCVRLNNTKPLKSYTPKYLREVLKAVTVKLEN